MLAECKSGDRGHVALTNRMVRRFNQSVYATDYPSIQAAIATAKQAGKGSVYIPDGDYIVEQTIQCAPGVDMVLAHNARLVAVGNVDVIKLAPRGGVRGGIIDCSVSETFDKTAILADGADRFYLRPTIISDVQFLGNGKGTAIGFYAKQAVTVSYVFGMIVRDFGISNFADGIHMQVEEATGEWAAVNTNSFSNGYIDGCDYGIHTNFIEAERNTNLSIDGNLFSNITIQPDASIIRALYCEGRRNSFDNVMVWDTQLFSDHVAVEFAAKSGRNMLTTALVSSYIVDNGTDNKIVTPDA